MWQYLLSSSPYSLIEGDMIDYKVLIRLSHHTDSAPVWLLVTQGAHVLHCLLFLAVEPVQLLPSSLQGNVGMSNPQLICKKPQDWNLVPPTTSKRLFKLRLNIPESLFFLVWLVKCGVPMTVEGEPVHNGCECFVLWQLWQIEVSGCLWVAAAVGGRTPKE